LSEYGGVWAVGGIYIDNFNGVDDSIVGLGRDGGGQSQKSHYVLHDDGRIKIRVRITSVGVVYMDRRVTEVNEW
jgi:hypothetical protein